MLPTDESIGSFYKNSFSMKTRRLTSHIFFEANRGLKYGARHQAEFDTKLHLASVDEGLKPGCFFRPPVCEHACVYMHGLVFCHDKGKKKYILLRSIYFRAVLFLYYYYCFCLLIVIMSKIHRTNI